MSASTRTICPTRRGVFALTYLFALMMAIQIVINPYLSSYRHVLPTANTIHEEDKEQRKYGNVIIGNTNMTTDSGSRNDPTAQEEQSLSSSSSQHNTTQHKNLRSSSIAQVDDKIGLPSNSTITNNTSATEESSESSAAAEPQVQVDDKIELGNSTITNKTSAPEESGESSAASEPQDGNPFPPTHSSTSMTVDNTIQERIKNIDILVIVMGEKKTFPTWLERLGAIKSSISLLFGSFDEEISSGACNNEYNLSCQVAFIPGTTWTVGRNRLAEEALRKEMRRGKNFDYWLFLDDDVDGKCVLGGEQVEQILGKGSCWQKIFNFIASDHVPENVSTISLPYGGNGVPGFVGFSNTDAMFAAFKRDRVPYLLPYVTLKEGSSEWISQVSLFCIMQTCMKSSAVFVPYVGGRNGAHRDYIRGLNLHDIRKTIADNYHDDAAGFHPCVDFSGEQMVQDRDFSGTFESGEELNEHIPPPDLELCEPLKKRFEAWESQIVI